MIFHMNHQQKLNCYFILIYENGDRLKSKAYGAPEYIKRFQYIGKNGLVDVEFYEDHKYNKRAYYDDTPVVMNSNENRDCLLG